MGIGVFFSPVAMLKRCTLSDAGKFVSGKFVSCGDLGCSSSWYLGSISAQESLWKN